MISFAEYCRKIGRIFRKHFINDRRSGQFQSDFIFDEKLFKHLQNGTTMTIPSEKEKRSYMTFPFRHILIQKIRMTDKFPVCFIFQ